MSEMYEALALFLAVLAFLSVGRYGGSDVTWLAGLAITFATLAQMRENRKWRVAQRKDDFDDTPVVYGDDR